MAQLYSSPNLSSQGHPCPYLLRGEINMTYKYDETLNMNHEHDLGFIKDNIRPLTHEQIAENLNMSDLELGKLVYGEELFTRDEDEEKLEDFCQTGGAIWRQEAIEHIAEWLEEELTDDHYLGDVISIPITPDVQQNGCYMSGHTFDIVYLNGAQFAAGLDHCMNGAEFEICNVDTIITEYKDFAAEFSGEEEAKEEEERRLREEFYEEEMQRSREKLHEEEMQKLNKEYGYNKQ